MTLKRMFERALALHPDYLLLSSWNEHIVQPQQAPGNFAMGLENDVSPTPGLIDGRGQYIDTYAFGYARDIEPSVENGHHIYDVMASCLRVYRRGGLRSCARSEEMCCQLADDPMTDVFSLKVPSSSIGSGDSLVTTSASERGSLVRGGWYEVGVRSFGSSVFRHDPRESDGYRSPFSIAATPAPQRVALYRCAAFDHFISRSADCEGYRNEGLIGYAGRVPEGVQLRPLLRCWGGANHFHSLTGACPPGTMTELGGPLGYVK